MNKCKCGRELKDGENTCPACTSKKSHWWKKATEVVVGVVVVVGGIAITVLTGGKGGKS